VGQGDANAGNKNNDYPDLDLSIRNTYGKRSSASNINSMYDSYIRAFRWASNRIKSKGVIAFVSNGGFIDSRAAEGFRKTLVDEFTDVYILNLRGDIRGAIRSGRKKGAAIEGGNVFGQASTTPVAITVLIRNPEKKTANKLHYAEIGESLNTAEKLAKIEAWKDMKKVDWENIVPNDHGDWINQRTGAYDDFIKLGDGKHKGEEGEWIFSDFTSGIKTNKDSWCYNFSRTELEKNVEKFIENYNSYLEKFLKKKISLSEVSTLPKNEISWSRGLLARFEKKLKLDVVYDDIQLVNYRPFVLKYGYRDSRVIDMQYRTRRIFPNNEANISISTTNVSSSSFSVLAISGLLDAAFLSGDTYPLYVYKDPEENSDTLFSSNDESSRKDAITDWSLKLFRTRYKDENINKQDIFNYVYGVLASTEFLEQFEQDARKSGPKVPLLKDFKTYSSIGESLVQLHTNFASCADFEGLMVEIKDVNLPESELYRVEKMSLIKGEDEITLVFNQNIKISGIPVAIDDFQVNGRSTLDWLVNQYQINKDKDTLLISDPNAYIDQDKYVFNLVPKLVNLSMTTIKILESVPKFQYLS